MTVSKYLINFKLLPVSCIYTTNTTKLTYLYLSMEIRKVPILSKVNNNNILYIRFYNNNIFIIQLKMVKNKIDFSYFLHYI